MNIDRIMFAVAGFLILLSLMLGHYVNEYWLLLAAFVGVNMFQAAFTRFCLMAIILKKMGVKPGCSFE